MKLLDKKTGSIYYSKSTDLWDVEYCGDIPLWVHEHRHEDFPNILQEGSKFDCTMSKSIILNPCSWSDKYGCIRTELLMDSDRILDITFS